MDNVDGSLCSHTNFQYSYKISDFIRILRVSVYMCASSVSFCNFWYGVAWRYLINCYKSWFQLAFTERYWISHS